MVTPDETGWRVGGERYWPWAFVTPETTVYAICPGRGFADAATVLGTDYLCIDGKVFRDHCMVIALGIDTQGRKHVLGLREGATETAAVTTGLLSDLVTRGLPTDRTLLFVVDGAAGLRRAITDVFGPPGVVQRCQAHKCRNVLGHLPERLHAYVSKALRDAWNLDSADRAARVLERLAGSLEREHPGAAASIRENLEETLTVQRLGLTGALQRTLRTTNIIENLNGKRRALHTQRHRAAFSRRREASPKPEEAGC